MGDEGEAQAVAQDRLEGGRQAAGLVLLGQQAVVEGRPGGVGGLAVAARHLLQGLRLAGGVERQHHPHRDAPLLQLGDLLDDALVALAHPHGVDDHPAPPLEPRGQAVDRPVRGEGVHGDAEDLGVDAQLLVGADAEAVGGDQGDPLGAVALHEARRELGRGGGLAHPGGPHQGDDAGRPEEGLLLLEDREP